MNISEAEAKAEGKEEGGEVQGERVRSGTWKGRCQRWGRGSLKE